MKPKRHVGLGILVVALALFFFIPLLSLLVFSLTGADGYTFEAWSGIFQNSDFYSSLGLSLFLAALTTILSLTLMTGTVLWVHLRAMHLRALVEGITLLVFAVPPITLVIGATGLLLGLAPWALGSPLILVPFYIVLAFAFTYRALDAGVRAMDLQVLVDAALSLGASWPTIIGRVILPNLRTALLGASFLTITVVLGEYVLSSLFLYNTLPVFMAEVGTSQAQGAAALALLTVLFTWLLLIVVSQVSRRLGGSRPDMAIVSS
jgi:putative spermidine/putrescine transport system permease protein